MKKEVFISNERIVYEELNGSKYQTIIFIHGSGATKLTWKNQMEVFLPYYTKIALDLPGHGQSMGNGFKSAEEYVNFIKLFIEVTKLNNVVLIGHSMGSAIALQFALSYGEFLKAIVIAGGGAKLKVHQNILDETLNDINYARKWAYCENTSENTINEAEQDFAKTSKLVRYNDFLACNGFDIMNKVYQISLPALIISGSCDKLTPFKYAKYLNDTIKNSRLAVINNAGHMSMWEKPNEFNKLLAGFLE